MKDDLPVRAMPGGPRMRELVAAVLDNWPEHEKFLRQSLAATDRGLSEVREAASELVCRLAEEKGRSLSEYAEDYRYLCEKIVFPEELYFRREGRYRLSTFEEANREVYANAPVMARYMNGLIVSDALWLNHARALADYALIYLAGPGGERRHLEIGPGHGLLLQLALTRGRFSSLTAWDISPTSIAHTGEVLDMLGRRDDVTLAICDIYDAGQMAPHAGRFDSIILSEVLEHLEDPAGALRAIRTLLSPGGRLWINAPANGPAPDHLYLFRRPEELEALVGEAGFAVARMAPYPVTGATLERALRQELPISVCIEAIAP
jgi:SAM-dependent methyltransferase